MPPAQRVGAVVAFGFRATLGATLQCPHLIGVFEVQVNLAVVFVEHAFRDAPLESQPQQFGKQCFGCHAPKACQHSAPLPTENVREP